MSISIKKRIYWSFLLLVSVFVINGIVTIFILSENRKLSDHISEIVDPSLENLGSFEDILIESKMFSTNWVFLRANEDDKRALRKLQETNYPTLKVKLENLSTHWENKSMKDSLAKVFTAFENLLLSEKDIMNTLQNFTDYDDAVKKFAAEEQLENIILPQTATLTDALNLISSYEENIRQREENNLEYYSMLLQALILVLAITIICLGIFLSVYMTKIILKPINKISIIINSLAKGITQPVNQKANGDEIGEMIRSVNNLSEKLGTTAAFAYEIGHSNFDVHFEPLSSEDTLGIALVAMRDNIKTTNENLLANNAELKKTNSELDKFVYSVSHDLRAPLSSMIGVVEITEEETQDAFILEHLGMLKRNIRKLDGFIMDILAYSRNSRMEIKKEEINFKEMLNDISNNLKYMSGNNRKVELKAHVNDGPKFISDKSRVNIVLNNLISNAIRYQNPSSTNPFVDIEINMSDTETGIIVKDNGIGISKENQQKIFEMFYRISESSVGSGLGLYIVKETVDKLKGKIEIESELGIGTSFIVRLPNSIINN